MLGTLALWAVLIAQAPDSAAQARYGVALRTVGDSLTALEAAAARFRADLVNASPDLVISRATRLTARCAGALHQARRLDSLLATETRLRRELAALRAALVRCAKDFATGPWYQGADSVQAWAPYRLARLDDAVRRYRLAAREFMHRLQIQ